MSTIKDVEQSIEKIAFTGAIRASLKATQKGNAVRGLQKTTLANQPKMNSTAQRRFLRNNSEYMESVKKMRPSAPSPAANANTAIQANPAAQAQAQSTSLLNRRNAMIAGASTTGVGGYMLGSREKLAKFVQSKMRTVGPQGGRKYRIRVGEHLADKAHAS